MKLKTVCVFCSADDKVTDYFKHETYMLGEALAKTGFQLLSGGYNTGLMDLLNNGHAAAAPELKRLAVVPEEMNEVIDFNINVPSENILWTADLFPSWTKSYYDLFDALIILPGGYGTMHELLDALVLSQSGMIKKPIILFNLNNFWHGTLLQFKAMVENHTLQQEHLDHLILTNSIHEIIAVLKSEKDLHITQGLQDEHWKKKSD